MLADKLLKAADLHKVKEVHLAGGVSANKRLREITSQRIKEGYFLDHRGRKIRLNSTPVLRYAGNLSYCTDNAAMIAAAAFFHYKKSSIPFKKLHALADPSLRMY